MKREKLDQSDPSGEVFWCICTTIRAELISLCVCGGVQMLFNIKVWLSVGGEVGFESLLVDRLRRRMVEEKSAPGKMSR